MDSSTNPPGFTSARAITVASLLLLLVRLLTLLASSREPDAVTEPLEPCFAIRGIPGPEDLELDRSDPAAPRLLISSQDRRSSPRRQGAIYGLKVGDDRPRPLPLLGRDGCSFHPHGLSLVRHDGRSYLYVINHHDEADSGPTAGCFAAGKVGTEVSSVEVFEVEGDALRFQIRLAHPEVLTNPNDLVALPNGTVWVTNPPAGVWPTIREVLTRRNVASRLVTFECRNAPSQPGCPGEWQPGRRFGAYLNGIAERRGGQELYVASTAEGKIYRLDPATARGDSASEPQVMADFAGPDNLSWTDDGRTRLLVAGHPDLRKYLQHFTSASAPSPSRVRELVVETGAVSASRDHDGSLLSAASVAVQAGGSWYHGQVLEPFILRCPNPGGNPL